jgi:hypothetical protein
MFEGLRITGNVPVSMRVGGAATVIIADGSHLFKNHNTPIIAMGSSKVTITGLSRITDNGCICNGAGIVATQNATVLVTGGSTLSGNRAIPLAEAGTTTTSSSTGSPSISGGRGGAIYINDSASVTVTQKTDVSGNVAAEGGGFAVAGHASLLITDGSKVQGNVAAMLLGGGVFCTEQAKVTISDRASFIGNVAVEDLRLFEGVAPGQPSSHLIPGATAADAVEAPAAPAGTGARGRSAGGSEAAAAAAAGGAGAGGRSAGGAAAAGVVNHGGRIGTGDMPLVRPMHASEAAALPMTTAVIDNGVDPTNPDTVGVPGPGGGAIAARGESFVTVNGNSSFSVNVAVNSSGGAVLAGENACLHIGAGTEFRSNVARHRHGGGLMLEGFAKAEILNSKFENNTALGGVGGSIATFWNSTVLVSASEFLNNTAFHDMGLVGPGGAAVQGEGGALYAADYAHLTVNDTCTFSNNSALRADDASVGPRVRFSIDESSGRTANSVLWMKSPCDVGEVKRLGWCEKCRVNHFSFDTADRECKVCPSYANCTGGAVLLPWKGHWRSSRRSTQIHKCPNPEACIGGDECAEGYTGRLCGSCASGYGQQKPFKCGKCMGFGRVVAVYIIGALVLLVLITYIVNSTLEDNMSEKQLLWPSDLLKVFITYMWYLLIVASIRLPWHDFITAVFNACGVLMSVTSSEVMSLDCVLGSESGGAEAADGGEVRGLPLAIKKQLVYLLVPVGMFGAVLGVQLLLREWQKRKAVAGVASKVALSDQLPVIAMVVVFFFHVPLCQLGLNMFACTIPLDKSDITSNPYPQFSESLSTAQFGYWVYDVQQACYEGWHLPWAIALGFPCVLIFCILLPAATFVLLYRKRDQLHEDRGLQMTYGSLYRTYKEERYFWEAVVAVQTVVLASISVFSHTVGVYYATLLLNAALGAIILMQLLCDPFEFKELHQLQLVATGCLLMTSYAGLSFLNFDREVSDKYVVIMCVLMAVLNVAFTLWCCYCIWRSSREIAAAALKKFTTFSRKSFRYVQHQLGFSGPQAISLQQQASAVERGQVVVVHADEPNGGDASPPSVVTCTGSVELSKELSKRHQSFNAPASMEVGRRVSRRATFAMPLHSPDVVPLENILDQQQDL